MSETQTPAPVHRTCGTCNICCKIVEVQVLNKPAHQWCEHAKPGKGCAIHGSHPAICQAWECGWMANPGLDERWKPINSGFVLRKRFGDLQLVVDVEPSKPDAWRREPFYSEIRSWAQRLHAKGAQVVVQIGRRSLCIFPEEEIDVGALPLGQYPFMGYESDGKLRRPIVLIRTATETVREVRGTLRRT